MYKSKSLHRFLSVVLDATSSEVWEDESVRGGHRLEPSRLPDIRESACAPGCRVCFTDQKYGFTTR
jgi:hypothetical protein